MAVIRRDIDREKAKLALQEAQLKPKSIEPIVISDDEEGDLKGKTGRKGKARQKNDFGAVDDDGVIHIDSDSDTDDSDIVEIMGPPGPRTSNSAPQGISLSALQASPNAGGVVDLQSISDGPPHSPGGPSSPKKRGSVSLRLDLSSEALRGIPAFGTDGPSPVTLAPRTGRILSAHPSMAPGPLDPFFMDLASSQAASAAPGGGLIDPSLLPADLLSAMTAQSQAQHDLIGSMPGTGVGQHLLELPPLGLSSDANNLAMNASSLSHQMDLDLFGEEDDDDDDEALVNSQLQAHDFGLDTSKLEPDNGDVVDSQELERLLSAHGGQLQDGASVGAPEVGVAAPQPSELHPSGDTVAEPPQDVNSTNLPDIAVATSPSNPPNDVSVSNQPETTAPAEVESASSPPPANPDDQSRPNKLPQLFPQRRPETTAGADPDAMVIDQPPATTTAPEAAASEVGAQIIAAAVEAAKSNPASVGGYTPYGLADLADIDMGGFNMNMDDMDMGSIDFSSLLAGNPSGASGSGGLDLSGLGMDFGGELGMSDLGGGGNTFNLDDYGLFDV